MKAAAVVTTQVMERVVTLPGVATLDWCDRAAAAMTRIHHPSAAAVAVGQVDPRCVLSTIEIVGAAASGIDTNVDRGLPRAAGIDLQSVRESLREGEWIGWAFQPLSEGAFFMDTIKVQPTPGRRGASPLEHRWGTAGPVDLLVGAVAISSPTPGRTLVAELAISGASPTDLARYQAVFAAILPLLGLRYLNAIGPEPADRHRWLTPREELILWKLVSGKKVPQIAAELHRSIYTVHDHVKALHRKLGATNRGQLVARALGHLGPLVARAADTVVSAADAGLDGDGVLSLSHNSNHGQIPGHHLSGTNGHGSSPAPAPGGGAAPSMRPSGRPAAKPLR